MSTLIIQGADNVEKEVTEDYDLSKVKNPELVSFMNDLLKVNERIKMEESVKDIASHYTGTNPND